MLFHRTGGRALILVDSAIRLEASAGEAELTASSEAGSLVLERVAQSLADHVVGRDERRLRLRFERCDDPDDARRSAAPSALDVLRAMAFGLSPIDRDEPFAVVALGVIGFDHVDMVEAVPGRHVADFPDLLFDLAETLVVVEPGGATRVLALAAGSDDSAEAHRQHHLAADRLARTVERCETCAPLAAPVPLRLTDATVDVDDEAFAGTV